MSSKTPAKTLEMLKASAERRAKRARAGSTRVTVQVGHCSMAVGAGEVAEVLASSLPDDAYLAIAGCDGACFAAPRVLVGEPGHDGAVHSRVTPEAAREVAAGLGSTSLSGGADADAFLVSQRRVALEGCGHLGGADIDDYLLYGGYAGLARALQAAPEEVIEEVKASGLRGRGGAYFPAALKWEAVRRSANTPKYMVVNSEEGEPGVFKDRHLMEGVPHRVLEGALIASYASGTDRAYVYINAEANLSAERMQRALDQARDVGIVGGDVLGSGIGIDLEIRRGAGGYVCGEETTLINTMEGYRREPRLRPPFPTEAGLLSRPTVINNPETLSSVPFIMSGGAAAFAEIGEGESNGTKLISLSGSVRRPGVVEVPMGTTLSEIIHNVGGGPPEGRTLSAIAVGGPSSGVLPLSMLNTPIGPGMLHDSGVMLGAGGVIALDDGLSVPEAVRKLAAYNADESCGKCTPCREGAPRMVEALDRLISRGGSAADLDELRYLAEVVGAASLCGLGQAAGGPITSALHFFGGEMAALAGVE